MHYLHSIAIISIFISQIKIIANCPNNGLENEANFDSNRVIPLKVVLPNDGTDYVLPSSELCTNNQKIDYYYLCPMTKNDIPKYKTESQLEWTIEKENCLKPVYTKPEEKAGSCDEDFTFSITQVKEEFQNVDVFIFGYDVCSQVDTSPDTKTIKSVVLEIYKVYVDATTKQTLHTEHRIISQKPISSPDFEIYMGELKLTYAENILKKLPRAYRNLELSKPKSKNKLSSFLSRVSSKFKKQKNKDSDKDKNKDYLTPQVLVPFTDLEPSSVKGANLNYLNIRPQYKRLRSTWDSINKSIWYKLFKHKLHSSTKIYTSTSRILIHNHKEVKIHVDKKFQIDVPLLWWHLIVTDDGRAIIILLYNLPLDFSPIYESHLLCETICLANGWNNIQEHDRENNIYVQCCEASDDFLKYLGFIKSDRVQIHDILNLHDNRRKSKRPQTIQPEEKETSTDDFVTNKPLLLLKKGFTESTFDSISMSSDAEFSFITESIVQGCPANISGHDCIRVVSPTETSSTSITCSREVQPNIVSSETPCADEGQRVKITRIFVQVCYNAGEEEEGEVKFAKTPMLYSVCYDKKKKETTYTTHKILTDEVISVNLDAKIYIKQLKTYCADNDVQQDLENMATFYEKYLQDNVVPQMLVPLVDMDLSYVMGANFHYLNIRPQYQRIVDRWNEINAQILKYLLENEFYKEVNIYTGTVLQLPNNPMTTELKLNDQFSISIPMIWYKMITLDAKSIVILIYNIPFKHHLTPEQRVCETSICATSNWLDIETDENENLFNANNVHVQCCETTEDILNYFKLSHIGKEINGEFEILKLPEKLTNPDTLVNEDENVPIDE